jgi:hypothetical protein
MKPRSPKMVPGPAGLYVPEHMADEAGMGCPLCDDHELVPLTPEWQLMPIIAKFRGKHRGHGDLESLERHAGKLFVTGKIPGLK